MTGETSFLRYPGSLDPMAQEFRPNSTSFLLSQIPVIGTPLAPIATEFFFPTYSIHPLPLPAQYHVQYLPPPRVGYLSTSPVLPHPPPAPTRSIALSFVPAEVGESVVKMDMEVFGEVRGLEMERACEGIVTVHFYDVRHADKALKAIRAQHMRQQSRMRDFLTSTTLFGYGVADARTLHLPPPSPEFGTVGGRAVWAQFIIPSRNSLMDGNNQGTIVLFNLDPDVSCSQLHRIFETFGSIKELRETPFKKQQRFIEFYDVRDAANALIAMDGKEVCGKQLTIEFSHPGGYGRKISRQSGGANPPMFSKFPEPDTNPLSPAEHFFDHRQRFSDGVIRFEACKSPEQSSFKHSLSFSADESVEWNGGGEAEKRNGRTRKHSPTSTSASPKHQHRKGNSSTGGSNRSSLRKGKHGKKFDLQFLISDDSTMEDCFNDSRTTVMIKNIPNKYSQQLIMSMLDDHCVRCNDKITNEPLSSYDFVYLPIDFNNKCNVGYGFVNMTSPQAAVKLHRDFNKHQWEVYNSRKICEVTYARVQGLQALKEHFKNSKFPKEMLHYLPVTFSPPRDGKQLTVPLPLVDHKKQEQNRQNLQSSPTILGLAPPSPASFSGTDGACSSQRNSHKCGSCADDESDEQDSCGMENGGDLNVNASTEVVVPTETTVQIIVETTYD